MPQLPEISPEPVDRQHDTDSNGCLHVNIRTGDDIETCAKNTGPMNGHLGGRMAVCSKEDLCRRPKPHLVPVAEGADPSKAAPKAAAKPAGKSLAWVEAIHISPC